MNKGLPMLGVHRPIVVRRRHSRGGNAAAVRRAFLATRPPFMIAA